MKLNCNKNEFQKFITFAERNSSKNPTLPILSGILLKTSKNKLNILSTNLEVGFEASIPAKVQKEGEVVIPSRLILSLLSSIPDDEILIESHNNGVKITSINSSTSLKCFPSEEFPILPRIKDENSFKISSRVLVSALRNTVPAAALSYTKPELASIYIFSKAQTPLTFTATDSFRLSEFNTLNPGRQVSILLPQKNAQELMRILEDSDEEVEVLFNNNQASFQTKKIHFVSRLTEGKFPEYQSIVPKSFLTQAIVDKNNFTGSVKAAGVFSSRLSDISLASSLKDQVLEIKSSHPDAGEHRSLCSAKVSGEEFSANFNYHYILDALNSISESKVFLGLNGQDKALLIRGFENGSCFHLVMPMKGL